MILQANPYASYKLYKDEIDQAIQRVLDSGFYLSGPEVETFEFEFARWMGDSDLPLYEAVAVANGTQALEIALRAHGIRPGDEVITTSLVPSPVVSAIVATGATPVLVDVGRDYEPSISQIGEAITNRTRALIAVHLYGIPLQTIGHIAALALRYGILLIEDCSQAHGATVKGHRVGTFGDVATFSFYPTKNLGALGDAGMLVTSSAAFAQHARRIRQYGWGMSGERVSLEYGINSRMDEIQAAVLRVKLQHLEVETAARREVAGHYRDHLQDPEIMLPPDRAGSVYHQFPIRVDPLFRNNLMRRLESEQAIQTAIHYRVPIHLQNAFFDVCRLPEYGGMQITEYLCKSMISLPVHVGLTHLQIECVSHFVRDILYRLRGNSCGI